MLCTGARILLESLKREGVDLFFGYPGGAVIAMRGLAERLGFVSLRPAPVRPIL